MVKRQPAPATDEIRGAVEAALAGKGRRLAELVKAVSTDDLGHAFGSAGQRNNYAAFHGLAMALCFAAGVKEQRAIQAADRRQWRKEQKAKP